MNNLLLNVSLFYSNIEYIVQCVSIILDLGLYLLSVIGIISISYISYTYKIVETFTKGVVLGAGAAVFYSPAFYSYFDFCLCFVLIFILFEKITFVPEGGQQVRWRIKNKSKGNKNKKDLQSWDKGYFRIKIRKVRK